jgi:hypothetical protein
MKIKGKEFLVRKWALPFFNPFFNFVSSQLQSCKMQFADLKMRGCSSQFGAVGVYTPYFQWT